MPKKVIEEQVRKVYKKLPCVHCVVRPSCCRVVNNEFGLNVEIGQPCANWNQWKTRQREIFFKLFKGSFASRKDAEIENTVVEEIFCAKTETSKK